MNDTSLAERIEALEYVLGQALFALEADSLATHARLNRLEEAVALIAPGAIGQLQEEDEQEPFSMDGLASMVQVCLGAMHRHQSVSDQKIAAIADATGRILSLGKHLSAEASSGQASAPSPA